ncbi:MAG TPA: hypothetical protein VG291_01160 [Xanthobacteraceae bacterium]|jgi:hypothetical protein|nr:hypothetical protein [Xanthobacteraceae bacterium]
MLRQEDLDAAVTERIVTQAQALRDFAAKRERAQVALLGHEERFRFMRGFNDFSMALPGVGVFNMTTMTAAVALLIAAVATLLALVAVVIDRRALLVSTFSYLGIVIVYAITTTRATAPSDPGTVFFSTLAVLGILVLGLGVGWQPLRRVVLAMLPSSLVAELPTVPV